MMMNIVALVMNTLVLAHVATGFIGLAAFWIPLFARKGGRVHVQAGRVFTYCAYVVTVSAVTASAGGSFPCRFRESVSRTGRSPTASRSFSAISAS